jgi:hypothetical protein
MCCKLFDTQCFRSNELEKKSKEHYEKVKFRYSEKAKKIGPSTTLFLCYLVASNYKWMIGHLRISELYTNLFIPFCQREV